MASQEHDVSCIIPRSMVILRPKVTYAKWLAIRVSNAPTLTGLRRVRIPYLLPESKHEDRSLHEEATHHGVRESAKFFLKLELRRILSLDVVQWPSSLTAELLDEWFDIECHECIMDLTLWGKGVSRPSAK